jgi:hypothetical protein
MAVHELILLLCEIARDKWCSYWEHDPLEYRARPTNGNGVFASVPELEVNDCYARPAE